MFIVIFFAQLVKPVKRDDLPQLRGSMLKQGPVGFEQKGEHKFKGKLVAQSDEQ